MLLVVQHDPLLEKVQLLKFFLLGRVVGFLADLNTCLVLIEGELIGRRADALTKDDLSKIFNRSDFLGELAEVEPEFFFFGGEHKQIRVRN